MGGSDGLIKLSDSDICTSGPFENEASEEVIVEPWELTCLLRRRFSRNPL